MVRKKSLCMFWVTLLSIFMFFKVTAFAEEYDIPDATNQFYINDFADIISEDVEKEMQENAVSLAESSNGVQVVVTTVRTIGDADPIYYTVDMYNKYEIGKNNMGVLIMLSVETRDIQIRIGDNMTKYLSDRKCGEIIDKYGIPYFKNDEFEKGLYEIQKATIQHITSNVNSAENEVAVTSTDVDDISSENNSKMILAFFTIFIGGIFSFFGIDKHLEKRREEILAEEIAIIDEKNREIETLNESLKSTQRELESLKERNKRAIMVYPDLNEKVDAILAKEKEEADKKIALGVEKQIERALTLECTRNNLNVFEDACNAFEKISCEQQRYVPTERVTKLKEKYNKSLELQRKFEEEEQEKRRQRRLREKQIRRSSSYSGSSSRRRSYGGLGGRSGGHGAGRKF